MSIQLTTSIQGINVRRSLRVRDIEDVYNSSHLSKAIESRQKYRLHQREDRQYQMKHSESRSIQRFEKNRSLEQKSRILI